MKVNALDFALLSEIIKKEKLLNEEELEIVADLTRNDFSFAAQPGRYTLKPLQY